MLFSFLRAAPPIVLGYLVLFTTSASAVDQLSFVVNPVALTATDGRFGPQLGLGESFTGFNGDPSIGATGEVAYPGDLFPAINGIGEGFWLSRGGQNTAIALTNVDGALGPGLGNGIVFDNTFHEALTGAPGDVLFGGFLAGPGIDDSNDLLYVRHDANGNAPLVRTGVANALGPGLGESIVFSSFFGAQINAVNPLFLRATIAGLGVTPATAEGFWRNTPAGNVALARSGLEGPLGPSLGAGVTFDNDGGSTSTFGQYQLVEGSSDVVFVGKTMNSGTSARNVGIWKNTAAGNTPLALSGATGDLGPGLGPNLAFGGLQQSPLGYMELDVNVQGAMAFFSTLSDGRRGVWRNLDQQNEPLMLVGASGALGPSVGIQDTFANFTPSLLLPEPAINDENVVLFPGLLANSRRQGLWLNYGDGNQVLALTGDDGELGPGLGPGITFTGFNRAYFGSSDTVYFTADLSVNVPFNRNLGLWTYRNGKIQSIAVYDELFDVDPTTGTDLRRVEWVQIPSDFTYDNDYGANNSNQLVFRMGFQDGSRGIFLAKPIPEPGSGAIYVALALCAVCLRRRRLW